MAGAQGNKNLSDAAIRLGVSPHTLRLLAVYQHRLPFLRMGRRILFRPADLEAFERQSLIEAK